MIGHLTLILALQLIGEVIARSLGLIIPGPVIGMALFLILMRVNPSIFAATRNTAMGLLAHLSLLFVPAGVGVVRHISALGNDALKILVVVFVSTLLTITVTALVFHWAVRE